MRWAQITLEVPLSLVDPASACLLAIGCAGAAIEDPTAVSSDPFANWAESDVGPSPGSSSGRCQVSGYLPVDDRLEAALDRLRDSLAELRRSGLEAPEDIILRPVADEAWAEAWKAHYKPLRAGRRFVVMPSWESWQAAPEDLVLEIDPGMAFGSGTHPSTRLCLELMEGLELHGRRVLDWGTGTGILAVGAALLGAAKVIAVDLDPVAVRAAAENAALNRCESRVRVSEGSIEDTPSAPPFDLVLANIVASPIIAGAVEIRRRLREGGHLIASGIIDQREAEVAAALEAAGLRLLETRADQEWRALLLRAQPRGRTSPSRTSPSRTSPPSHQDTRGKQE